MKSKYIALIAVAVLALAVVPFGDADGAYIEKDDTYKFDNMSGGTLTFTVKNTGAVASTFTMDVSVTENGKEVASAEGISIPAGEVTKVSIKMGDFKSVGTHTLNVVCTTDGYLENPSFNVTVDVSKNLLSDWVTYVVIIIVIIVIAAFAYLKIRDAPKKKTEMTFEQLESERKAEMSAKGKKKAKDSAPTTERQRYLANKKKKD